VTTEFNDILIQPYGGRLVNLLVDPAEREDLRAYAGSLPSLQLSTRNLCDLELLATGGFSPLDRFMGQTDYQRVLDEMCLADGTLFPIPVTLTVKRENAPKLDSEIALSNSHNDIMAVMRVDEIFEWDKDREARSAYGSTDGRHPTVAEMNSWGELCISGALRVLQTPRYYDFKPLRLTPHQVRARLSSLGQRNVVAFQTRNPLHRAHEELTTRAARSLNGTLLLHPTVGLTKPGDIDHFTRVRTYKILAERYYDPAKMLLALLPLAMRMAGPREALWHALIRRNYGANHLIVGRDHASPGVDSQGRPFYGPYDAQELVASHQDETGVRPVLFSEPATS
jgi:sulfate adenylyltransferase